MKLLSFESYQLLTESIKSFDKELDKTLNENIGAALGSPVKFTKIKNNAKKYQQSLVQIAINNLDFEKKKAAGNLDKEKADILKAANAQKNQALKDQASAISDRIDQLATTAGLKTVASIAKNKSKLAAAETALKTADGEEAKALKLKIKDINQKVAADQSELSDYEKGDDKKDDDASNQQNLDNIKTGDSADKEAADKEAADKEAADKAAADKEAADKEAADKEAADKSAADKEAADKEAADKEEPTNRPESGKNSKDDMIARYQKLISGTSDEEKKKQYQAKLDQLKNESEESFLNPKFLAVMESELAAFESKASLSYLNESVSTKFKRLMENRF